MADSGGIPELKYTHPDGQQKNRLEMEQWLRQEVPKVHWLRIIASRAFNLPKQVSWDMREIVLKHWLLDEMIRRGLIVGDQLGVNANASNDEGELRQFTQRLAALIQAGHAVSPQHAEGVDMNGYTPPPPPVMGAPIPQNGTSAYPPGPPQPPPPPSGPPQGYAQPPAPAAYTPPQQAPHMAPPPAPPGPPQMQPPMGPPGYGPPQGPPQGPPPGVPQGIPQGPPPGVAAAPAPGRRGRPPKAEAPQQAQAPQMGPPGMPQGFAPAPLPGAQPGFPQQPQLPFTQAAPQQQAAPQAASVQDNGPLLAEVHALRGEVAELKKLLFANSMMTTILARGIYQKQGSADVFAFLQELGQTIPQ